MTSDHDNIIEDAAAGYFLLSKMMSRGVMMMLMMVWHNDNDDDVDHVGLLWYEDNNFECNEDLPGYDDHNIDVNGDLPGYEQIWRGTQKPSTRSPRHWQEGMSAEIFDILIFKIWCSCSTFINIRSVAGYWKEEKKLILECYLKWLFDQQGIYHHNSKLIDLYCFRTWACSSAGY